MSLLDDDRHLIMTLAKLTPLDNAGFRHTIAINMAERKIKVLETGFPLTAYPLALTVAEESLTRAENWRRIAASTEIKAAADNLIAWAVTEEEVAKRRFRFAGRLCSAILQNEGMGL